MKVSKKKSTAFREIQLMQAVSDPHVISCYEVVNERNVVMDLMDYDLKKVIEDQSTVLAEAHVKAIAIQIMKGIAAIHQQGFMHRDITPSNVLVNSSTGVVKLSDFGIARTLGCSGRRMTPVCTIHAYRSPEGLHGARTYTQAVDLWSVGCVIAEMFKRKELFPGRSDFDMLERVLRSLCNPTAKTFERLWLARAKKTSWADVCGSSWMVRCAEGSGAMAQLVPSASPIAHRFLHRLLQLHPSRRPSADQALSDQFFDAVQLGAFDLSSLPFVRRVAERLQF
jgi:serine/threonine protein kinase